MIKILVTKGFFFSNNLDIFFIHIFFSFLEAEVKKESSTDEKPDIKKAEKDEKDTKDEKKDKKEVEATFELLSNPARVMKPQLQVVKMEPPSSLEKVLYEPIKDLRIGGK